jgi:hypothetical protein
VEVTRRLGLNENGSKRFNNRKIAPHMAWNKFSETTFDRSASSLCNMRTRTIPGLAPTSQSSRRSEMTGPEGQERETARSGWIQRYMDLLKKRKLLLIDGKLPGRDLSEALAHAESELKQVWKQLSEHGASHSSAA